MKTKLLDLFCGAGGASMGYYRAGFDEIVGVDICDQKNYPFDFVKGDALGVDLDGFDFIHASPPCQAFCKLTGKHRKAYGDYISATREKLVDSGRLFVIENIEGAPLLNYFILCGSMFGLNVRRHRLFESPVIFLTPGCNHKAQRGEFESLYVKNRQAGKKTNVVGVHGKTNYAGELQIRREAMGIDWMENKELVQALPPAYTEFIGKRILQLIT